MTINRDSIKPSGSPLAAGKPVQPAARLAQERISGLVAVVPPSGVGRSYASRFHSGLAGLWNAIRACFSPGARTQAGETAGRPAEGAAATPTAPAARAWIDPEASQREAMDALYAALEQPAGGDNLDAVVHGLRQAVGGPQAEHLTFAQTLDAAIEKAMDRYRDFHMPDSDSSNESWLRHLRRHPDVAERALDALPPALRAKARTLLSTVIWNMGYGHAEAFSFLLLARKVQASMACVTADDARSTGDNPYVEQALRSACGFAYDAPDLGLSGLTLDTPDARLVELVENLSWRYQSGIYPASHGPDVTRAAMTGFKALTPQELDKLELITRLRCGQRKFAVATGENFLTGEQGQPLGYFMRDALRACYEARIGQSLASCVRALRRQGFPQTYASNMQAARSMMASAAGTVLGSAGHYAHTLDASLPPDAASASRQLLHAGLAQQSAEDAELIMGLLEGASGMPRATE